MRKIGVCLSFPEGADKVEYTKMIRNIGFESCFTDDSAECVEAALSAGLEIDNIHAPFDGINNMWFQGMSGEKMLKRLTDTVDLCAQYGIKKAIIHLSAGDEAPHINDIGISRFDRLIKHAQSKNILLAFENQRKLANLAFIMEKYGIEDNVGFCWDVGHETCFARGREYMPLFGSRIIALHLQDNHCQQSYDQHLIPFDGTVDMDKAARYLKASGYDGPVMLEVFKRPASYTHYDGYEGLTLEQYYKRAFDAGVRFRDMIDG